MKRVISEGTKQDANLHKNLKFTRDYVTLISG